MRSVSLASAPVLALLLAAAPLAAQDSTTAPLPFPPIPATIRDELPASLPRGADVRYPTGPRRVALLGVELSVVKPHGEFRRFVKQSFGFALQGLVAVDKRGSVALGGDFRSVAYDSRDYQDTITVKNMMRTLTVGSRYMAPIPWVRPYVGAAVGAAYFGTETNVRTWEWDDDEDEWQQVTRLAGVRNARMTWTLVRSAGLHMDFYRGRHEGSPWALSLDLGVSDHDGGRTSYLVDGRGPRVRTGTDYRVYRFGVSIWNR